MIQNVKLHKCCIVIVILFWFVVGSDQIMLPVIKMSAPPKNAALTLPTTPAPCHTTSPASSHDSLVQDSNLQQPPCFEPPLVPTAPDQSDPSLTTTHAYSKHHMLTKLESCVAIDYQSHTITNNVVPNMIAVEQMNGLTVTLPASSDVNNLAACYDTFPTAPSPYFSTSSPLSSSGSVNSCLSSPVFPQSCYVSNGSTSSCFLDNNTSPSLSGSSSSSCVSSPEFPKPQFDFGMAPQTPMSSNSLYPSPFNPSSSIFNFDSNFDCLGNGACDYPSCGGNSGSVSGMMEPHPPLFSIVNACPVTSGDAIHFDCTPFDIFDDAGGDPLTETFFTSVMQETTNSFSVVPSLISQGLWYAVCIQLIMPTST